jgi:hypothetical protein
VSRCIKQSAVRTTQRRRLLNMLDCTAASLCSPAHHTLLIRALLASACPTQPPCCRSVQAPAACNPMLAVAAAMAANFAPHNSQNIQHRAAWPAVPATCILPPRSALLLTPATCHRMPPSMRPGGLACADTNTPPHQPHNHRNAHYRQSYDRHCPNIVKTLESRCTKHVACIA